MTAFIAHEAILHASIHTPQPVPPFKPSNPIRTLPAIRPRPRLMPRSTLHGTGLRKTATTFSTGTTNSRLSPSKSTGIASLGLNKTRSY